MSGFSDMAKDAEKAAFIRRWTEAVDMPEATEENLRWNVARARAAEHELSELKNLLRNLKGALADA